jgi:hypothetical protein
MMIDDEKVRLERLYARYDARQAALDLGDHTWHINPDMRNWYYDECGIRRYKRNDQPIMEKESHKWLDPSETYTEE